MNTSRSTENPVRATYMTQDEANEVMELWAERQREEAARLSLVTVHDVAEAIQVSPDQVDYLLQEVRAKRMQPEVSHPSVVSKPFVLPGSDRAWLMSGVIAVGLAIPIGSDSQGRGPALFWVGVLVMWGIAMVLVYTAKTVDRWIGQKAVRRALRDGHSLTNLHY